MYQYGFSSYYEARKAQDFVLDKDASLKAYKGYFLNRILKMFKYEGLPKTIPHEMLEFFLLLNGSCVIAEVKGNLYAFEGSFGGEPDPYYRPTLYTVANPALKLDKNFKLWDIKGELNEKDCVFCTNDYLWMGLSPLIGRYSYLLSENLITLRTADVMLRILSLLTAPDDATKAAGEAYIKAIELGKTGVIMENRFFDGIKMQSPPSNNGSYLTQFIELHQYLTGQFFSEIGINANFNMKRESISKGESELSRDTLLPLIESMLACRERFVSQLNSVFGTDISVRFDSVWAENIEQRDLEIQALKAEIDSLKTPSMGPIQGGDGNGQAISTGSNEPNSKSEGFSGEGSDGTSTGNNGGDFSGQNVNGEEGFVDGGFGDGANLDDGEGNGVGPIENNINITIVAGGNGDGEEGSVDGGDGSDTNDDETSDNDDSSFGDGGNSNSGEGAKVVETNINVSISTGGEDDGADETDTNGGQTDD